MAGTEVTSEVRMPRLAYLGDSAPEGLDACEAMYAAEVLIMELTFVAPSHRKDKIHKFGHMHLDDFLERRDRFRNELIIASHFSTRYHPQPDPPARGARPARPAGGPAALVDMKRDWGLGIRGSTESARRFCRPLAVSQPVLLPPLSRPGRLRRPARAVS